MGKKVKKKVRSVQKEKRVLTASPKTVSQQSILSTVTADDAVSSVKERTPCCHLAKGIDVDKLSSKLRSSEPVRCDGCREGVVDRRAVKGKGKHGKKKGGGSSVDSRSDSKAIWVCLECGHFSCGGAGLPTTPQSHAVRHAKQNRHPLAAQFENPHLLWCFPCDKLIPFEKSEGSREEKDVLHDILKVIKGRPPEGFSGDVEETRLGSGSVTSELKSEDIVSSSTLDGRGGYVVRGLVNLGNTCFFNSVLQNLLAMNKFRDYFFKLEESVGPLTSSLKKLFIETSPESGLRNVIHPRSLFGCVCAKAPQFRGYQQHDSHELLRCLLDGLCTEDSAARKQIKSFQEDGTSPTPPPTFVDAIFGGQLSSTVTCLECDHSSIVYEPFLDLSLPIPTKKPPSKKAQPVSQAKKPKLPPRRSGRIDSKVNRDANPSLVQSVSDPSTGGQSQIDEISVVRDFGNKAAVQNDALLENTTETSKAIPSICTEGTASSSGELIGLDYCEPGKLSDDCDMASQINDTSVISDFENNDIIQNEAISKLSSESDTQFGPMESNAKVDHSTNSWEDEAPLQVLDSEILLLPYREDTSINGEIFSGEGEVSASAIGFEQDTLEFDGFGDLFDEVEAAAGPSVKPLSSNNTSEANGVADTGFMVKNSSESDPDEVDHSDSPVSVESCLAYFTKSEFLSKNVHAWQCENCSKAPEERKMRSREKLQKPTSIFSINGGDNKNPNAPVGLGNDCRFPTEDSNLSNGNSKRDVVDTSDYSWSLHNGRNNRMQSYILTEPDPVASQLEDRKGETEYAPPNQLQSSSWDRTQQMSFSSKAIDSCSVHELDSVKCNTNKVQKRNSQFLAERKGSENSHEDGDQEDEEINSECVKVKRDATKRILINSAPPILTLHLKRFSQDGRGRLSKLNGHVVFKEVIDLKPYMDPRCTSKRGEYNYRLVGVVEHLGSMRGGHYVAHVRGSKNREERDCCVWYYASDYYVRESSLEEVLCCDAYILFYEQF